MIVYAVKFMGTGEYCRFESYSKLTLVPDPLQATIYRRKRDAEMRAGEGHWIQNAFQPSEEFCVSTLEGTLTEIEVDR